MGCQQVIHQARRRGLGHAATAGAPAGEGALYQQVAEPAGSMIAGDRSAQLESGVHLTKEGYVLLSGAGECAVCVLCMKACIHGSWCNWDSVQIQWRECFGATCARAQA